MATVRQSTDDRDLERVLEVMKAAFALHARRIDPPSGAGRETVDSLRAKLASETLLVAGDAGEIAGCIWCRADGGDVYIGRLAVEPTKQGRGVGQALLRAAIEWAEARGAKTMSLGVRVELTENIALFERYGFRITGSESHTGYQRPTSHHMVREM